MTPLSAATGGLLDGGSSTALAIASLGFLHSGSTPPVVVPVDTGGSGNRSHGSGRRNINDDPDAFSELLKEWRARRKGKSDSPKHIVAERVPEKDTHPEPDEDREDIADDLQDHLRRVEAAFDRSMVAYEAALAKVEQAKVAKAAKAQKVARAAENKARQAAIEQEELARQQAMQLAIEWELARLAYEDFLEEEDEIMLLS